MNTKFFGFLRCFSLSASCFGFIFLLLLTACNSADLKKNKNQVWSTDSSKIKVLSTTAMINDLVIQVADDLIEVKTLIEGGLDPHSYELVKGDDEKVMLADIIFFNGLGLEHGPSLNMYLSQTDKGVALGDMILEKEPDLIIEDEGQIDPHIWMDVSLWSKNVEFIVSALSNKDPVHKDIYEARGKLLVEKMIRKHDEIYLLFQQIPEEKRYLVTSHDAFNYFTRAYLKEDGEIQFSDWKKRFNAPEGLAPEGQISVKDIQNIIDHMKKYQIEVIFPESNVSRDSIKKIVDAGQKEGLNFCIAKTPLYGDAMGKPQSLASTYLGMMESNAKTIASYLNQDETCQSK